MKYKLIAERNQNLTASQQVLVNRGIPFASIDQYLRTTDEVLIDGKLLDNMAMGIQLLVKHIMGDSKILIQVDSDADGYTSAAVLYNYLYKMAPSKVGNISFRIHNGKEHGIILEETLNRGYNLVIIPDAGSNQYAEHKALKEAGIDVLVLDHHDCEHYSEDAVVINNQLSERYENKAISGVGVVYKFCKVIDELTKQNIADNYLDLVALGMVADMMDMRSIETKHLVGKGLANIQNPFFKGLVERQAFSLGATITPIGVAFYIAPLINATIRVGTQEEKMVMFKSMLENTAYAMIPSTKRGCKGQLETLVEQATRNSINIKSRQKRMTDEGVEKIEAIIARDNLTENQIIVVETSTLLDSRLTGLVANKLMAKYQKPVLLLRRGENGMMQGSGRGYDKSEFNNFKEFLGESDLFEYAEGHQSAFGAGIKEENIDEFMAYSNEMLSEYDFDASYKVDFILDANDIKLQDILDVANMKPLWGKGMDEAYVIVKGIRLTKDKVQLLSRDRNPTLKITLGGGLSLIKFGSNLAEFEKLCPESGYVEIDVCGKCSINEWNGNISPQILVEKYEVVNVATYYF
jgi:single-stranded-DNA-specific exonuclease